ncbi:MAG: efflux RND transporter periplasmic adaptor subunit [Flavobacteriaceae bacterium]|nr:efflux RND transporter periplasmic adaptor subunit [Candidatus Onthonaster equi]
MNKKRIFIIIISLAVLVGLIIYRINANQSKDEKPTKGAGPSKEISVEGKIIKKQYFSDFLTLSGSMEANEQIDLQSEVSGIIESINFDEGKYVSRGQILIRLNDVELRAQLAQAKTRNTLASENQRRAKLLLEKEAISQEEFDIATADYRTSQSQIQIIEAQLSKTVIRAPFSGRVGLRNVSKGSYITPSTIIAKLVNTDQIKVTFSIPEKYAHMVKVNNVIKFNVQGNPNDFNARVYATEPVVETATRTLLVKAITTNNSNQLIPGTFADIVFPLESTNDALLVPAEALIPIQNGKKIFVYKSGKAKEVIVEIGSRTKDDIQITSGISDGDTILTTGVMTLKNDSPVKVVLRK